jgi:voltage-gated potassium channel
MLLRGVREVWRYYALAISIFIREPMFRALGLAAFLALMIGTVFYHFVEGWGWIDTFYFSTVTLATIGYGDLAPVTTFGRLFTVFYALFGLGIVATFVSVLIRAPFLVDDSGSVELPTSGVSGLGGAETPEDRAQKVLRRVRQPNRHGKQARRPS